MTVPSTVSEAESWVEIVVAAIGPRFHPGSPFADYDSVRMGSSGEHIDLTIEQKEQLDAALQAVRRLLGERFNDLAYRGAVSFLEEIDGDWSEWARPVTQPPARWWLVERDDRSPPSSDATTELAYEDDRGTWWIWEPATRRMHADMPWLGTDYYYEANAHRDRFVEHDFGRLRFTLLSPTEARAVIETGRAQGAPDVPFGSLRREDDQALDPEDLLPREP